MFTEEHEIKLIELLALVYNAVPWSKMRTSKSPHDIFNHRVRAASRRATLYEAISKLANYFGMQSLPNNAIQLIVELRPVEKEVLNKLYTEHILISMLSILRAKQIREAKRRIKTEIEEEEEQNEEI